MSYDATRAITDMFPGVPSDTDIISAFGFYVGGDVTGVTPGDVTVMPSYQEKYGAAAVPVTFKNVPVGTLIRDVVISRLMATGTTATDIVMLGPI